MSKAIYISFNDDDDDPTYQLADTCLLVHSAARNGNPVSAHIIDKAPALPKSLQDIEAFCRVMNWGCEIDEAGQVVIFTGVFNRKAVVPTIPKSFIGEQTNKDL